MGRTVELAGPPQRIVSLVPSQTELLFSLGLRSRVAGITRYCVHPADAVRNVVKVGGTKRFRFDVIESLAPDLIIGNKEENTRDGIERLAAVYPVWISDVASIDDAVAMIAGVGAVTGKKSGAAALSDEIVSAWSALPQARGLSVAYLVWKKPWMAVGSGTFIGDVLTRLGFRNRFAGVARYPEIELQCLRDDPPDVLMLSSEPFPFDECHVAELASCLPDTVVLRVDGEPFSWYGSRLVHSPGYFADLVTRIVDLRGSLR